MKINMQVTITFVGLFAGFCLAGMVFFNGLLAKYINPIEGSFVVHIIGLITSILLALIWKNRKRESVPNWAFLTGIFGGLAVAIVGFTVNKSIGISGTIGLAILGQIIFGWLCDSLGLFGNKKRKLELSDFIQVLLILSGVGILIYG
jgi:transporter family-2 protein